MGPERFEGEKHWAPARWRGGGEGGTNTYTQWGSRRETESKSGELIVARAADEAATIRKPDL